MKEPLNIRLAKLMADHPGAFGKANDIIHQIEPDNRVTYRLAAGPKTRLLCEVAEALADRDALLARCQKALRVAAYAEPRGGCEPSCIECDAGFGQRCKDDCTIGQLLDELGCL